MQPTPARLDPEEQLKRDSLAWEIRKFRLDLKARTQGDADRLQLDRDKFNLEKLQFERDRSFWARLGPTLVTSCTAVLGALFGLFGVLYQQHAQQQTAATNTDIASQTNAARAMTNIADQVEQRAKIVSSNTQPVAEQILTRLEQQSGSEAARQLWAQGLQMIKAPGSSPVNMDGSVYVHYQQPSKTEAVNAVIAALTKAGYYVPAAQQVTQNTTGDVRFSAAPNDAATGDKAKNIALLVENALESVNERIAIAPINIHASFPKVPATTFEVWLPAMPN